MCRRPLDPADVSAAATAHEQSMATLRRRETQLGAAVTEQTQLLRRIRALISRAAQLRVPTASSTVPSDGDIATATEELEQARAVEARWVERVAEARVQRNLLAQQITDEESTATLRRRSQVAHRREAVANIAAQVMAGTAQAVRPNASIPSSPKSTPVEAGVRRAWRVAARRMAHGWLHFAAPIPPPSSRPVSSGEKVIAFAGDAPAGAQSMHSCVVCVAGEATASSTLIHAIGAWRHRRWPPPGPHPPEGSGSPPMQDKARPKPRARRRAKFALRANRGVQTSMAMRIVRAEGCRSPPSPSRARGTRRSGTRRNEAVVHQSYGGGTESSS